MNEDPNESAEKRKQDEQARKRETNESEIDEAVEESFPASDPPSTSMPSKRRQGS